MPSNITVVGSICLDLGLKVPHLPGAGETVLSRDIIMPVGGKGFNQALQAHRLGSRAYFFGRLGDDPAGKVVLEQLINENFPVRGLRVINNEKTALGLIFIAPDGRNMIGGFSGANMNFSAAEVDQNVYDALHISSHLILQMEIPDEANYQALKLAKEHYVRTVMNFAPYREISKEVEKLIDIFIFNEIEAEQYFNMRISDADDVKNIRDSNRYVFEKIYIVTLGEKGAAIMAPEGFHKTDGIKVNSVDTTGAGDSFIGAYVHFVASGAGYLKALEYANVVAAESTKSYGAMPSLPKLEKVGKIFLEMGLNSNRHDHQ